MFTGIVEEMGAVTSLEQTLGGTRLTILASTVLADLKIGDSISINGTCLTVVAKGEQSFVVEASPETLSVTTLGQLTGGAPVTLAGHIDGVGTIRSRRQEGNAVVLVIEAPSDVLRYCVHKGSVTVDGISLTINDATDDSFSVSIIPHTAAVTTLGLKQVDDQVNLESDLIGKFVERLLQQRSQLPKPTPVIDKDYLKKHGLM